MTSVLKSLKLYARMHKVSILATATTGPQASLPARKSTGAQASLSARKSTGAQASLPAKNSASQTPLSARYAQELHLASLADSAIILAPSTYGPEYRYTKLLSTRNRVPENLSPTSTEVLTYQLNTMNPPSAIRDPQLSSFTFLGPSNEQDHLRNYTAEALEADREHDRQLKKLQRRSNRAVLVDGILDGTYMKYLKGE